MNSRRPWFVISMPLPAHAKAVRFELARSSIANTTSLCLRHKLSRLNGEHHAAHRAQVYSVWLAQRFQLHWAGLSPHDRAAATPLFSAPSLAALLDAPVGLTLERRDQRFYTQAD